MNTASVATQKRAYALDALRGFAILAMVLSGTITYQILPAWMYHAQEPPPTHTYNSHLSGLTWVDVVLPLFLFSMGAAIPLALSRRIEKGFSTTKIILSIFKRGFLLGTFAIVLQHVRPQVINPNDPEAQKWWIALLGFLIIFFMFVRLPNSWQPWQRRVITISAWVAAVILLSFIRYPGGSRFSIFRSDIILILLTNTAVFGSIIWLFTKSNLLLRLGCLGILLALRLSSRSQGWVSWLWSATPVPWIFKIEYLQYLFLVIPGTIIGDLILDWMQNRMKPSPHQQEDEELGVSLRGSNLHSSWFMVHGDEQSKINNQQGGEDDFLLERQGEGQVISPLAAPLNSGGDVALPSASVDIGRDSRGEEQRLSLTPSPHWSVRRLYTSILLMFIINFVLLCGLQSRWLWPTTLISAILCFSGWFLFDKPLTETESLLNKFYKWGIYWLAIGLIFEPYENGIKKDPPTMSYYFLTAAMATFILIAFTIIIDILKQRKWLQLLIDNGQNPMIAYVAFANFLWPILTLTGIETIIIENSKIPLIGFLKGLSYTMFIAWFVSLFTKLKIFWRT